MGNRRKRNTRLVLEMLEMQDRLNVATCGPDWRSGICKKTDTSEGRIINWLKCIAMETAEYLDSFNWKHWKDVNSEHDLDNAKVEVVDIWHFMMSQALATGMDLHEFADNVAYREGFIVTANEESIFKYFMSADKEAFMSYRYLTAFMYMMRKAKLSFDDLYKMYMGKNALNIFRQECGYDMGNYVKYWPVGWTDEPVEDNIVMQHVIETKKPEEYLETLKEIYFNK